MLLLPLLQPAQGPGAESGVARLLEEHAAPVVKGIIRGKLRASANDHPSRQEAEDLYGEVVVQLLTRLRAFVTDPDGHSIGDFRGYVAVTTYNACNLYLRKKYPARWRLKNRLRYALSRGGDFALWQGADGDWLCGLRAWGERGEESAEGARRLRLLGADTGAPLRAALGAKPGQTELPRLLRVVFQHAGGPVRLDELHSVVADLQGVSEPVVNVEFTDEHDFGGRNPDVAAPADFTTEVERRSYLRRLWDEITRLPPMQRAALLLNLRDAHEGVIALLPTTGVAGVRQIASAVGMPAEQFAALWNRLPLDDAAVAGLLGVTRQQVINLRKSARARLARRMLPLDRPR